MLNMLPSGIKAHQKIEILNYDTVSEGGGDYLGDLKYLLLIFTVHTIMD